MKPIPAIVEKDLAAAFAALDPQAREEVMLHFGMDPGPRSWTSAGIRLGVPQYGDGDGHVFAAWPLEMRRTHRVYFIQAGDLDTDGFAMVKIGFTTDIEQRLRQLQTASPLALKIAETVIGSLAIEAFFHRELSGSRIRGEWYRLCPDDIAYATQRLYEEGLWS